MKLIEGKFFTKEERDALKAAIEDEWSVNELQPLIYGRIKEEDRYPDNDNNIEMGISEKIISLIMGGVVLIGELVKLTEEELIETARPKKERGVGLGIQYLDDVYWALQNISRHEEFEEVFVKEMMPNELPTRKMGND